MASRKKDKAYRFYDSVRVKDMARVFEKLGYRRTNEENGLCRRTLGRAGSGTLSPFRPCHDDLGRQVGLGHRHLNRRLPPKRYG